MVTRRFAACALVLAASPALADDHAHHPQAEAPPDHAHHHPQVAAEAPPDPHEHHHHPPQVQVDGEAPIGGHHHHASGSGVAVSLGVLAADYDAPLFTGTYQGVVAGARWTSNRFAVAARLPAYRLAKNGKVVDGIGDVMLHGHAQVIARGAWSAGAMLMLSAPTGDGDAGLGMGHAMVMPELWAARAIGALSLGAGAGYARMIGGTAAHAEHGGGMWPLVDPMNASELTYRASATLALAKALAAGVRLDGAMALGDGTDRAIGTARVVWIAGRTETAFELQHGMTGSPFGVRGLLETSIRLD